MCRGELSREFDGGCVGAWTGVDATGGDEDAIELASVGSSLFLISFGLCLKISASF